LMVATSCSVSLCFSIQLNIQINRVQ
jgi:hypothetical protein